MESPKNVFGFANGATLPAVGRRPMPSVTPLRTRTASFHARTIPRASLHNGGANSGHDYLQVSASEAIRSLLTRRAVRTIAYYFREMHDSATHNWLLGFENFQERAESNSFHDDGTFLYNMIRAQNVQCSFVIGHPRGYFKREFKFTIEPYKVANKVISARTQLASEWAHDLRCIALENKELERMTLERALEPDEKKLDALRGRVFDFDSFASDQTPLRYSNYKKLKLLVTQQAIARLELVLRDTSNYDYMFFKRFVKSAQPLKNDESFIIELMSQAPETRVNPEYEVLPRTLAMQLMDLRKLVAEEFIAVMNSIPEEHASWSRQRLEASFSLSSVPLGEDFKEKKSSDVEEKDTNSPTRIDSANSK